MSAFRRFLDWLLPNANFDRAAYLAKATDVVDLERRIRDWEHQPHGLFN